MVSALSTKFGIESREMSKILRGYVMARLIANSECKTTCNTSLGTKRLLLMVCFEDGDIHRDSRRG